MKNANAVALDLVELVKASGLHNLLECDTQENPYKFHGSAELYVESVNIMVHEGKNGGLRFSPSVPPDDKGKVPKGALKGFSAPRDFNAKEVAKKIRLMCRDVLRTFEEYGVTGHLYDDEFRLDEAIRLDENGKVIGEESPCECEEVDFDPNEGEEWKKGTDYDSNNDGEGWKTGTR